MEAYQRLAERSPYMRCLLKAVPWICWVDVSLVASPNKNPRWLGKLGIFVSFWMFLALKQIQGGSKHWWHHESQGRRGCKGSGSSRHASCAGIAAKDWGISDQALFVTSCRIVRTTSWPIGAPVLGDNPESWDLLREWEKEFHCQIFTGKLGSLFFRMLDYSGMQKACHYNLFQLTVTRQTGGPLGVVCWDALTPITACWQVALAPMHRGSVRPLGELHAGSCWISFGESEMWIHLAQR